MASVRVARRPKAAVAGGPGVVAARGPEVAPAAQRREQVELRVGRLAQEETRLAREGFYEGAQEAARQRRYWEFLRALMDAPLARPQADGAVH